MPDAIPPVTADELRHVELLDRLDDAGRAWVAARLVPRELAAGERLFARGAPADWMIVVLAGTLHIVRDGGPPLFVIDRGEISGRIPFSRMTAYGAEGRAATALRVGLYPAAEFPALLAALPVLEPAFVSFLADRVRESTRLDQSREKLASLGKLAAGLAHELNNPASAARRAAEELRRALDAAAASALVLLDCDGLAVRVAAVRERARAAREAGATGDAVDALERSDREEAVAERLGVLGIADPWLAASAFVDAGLVAADLEALLDGMPDDARPPLVAWLADVLAADALAAQVGHAASRISDLVAAVKAYTHMDEAPALRDEELRGGLEATLAMFAPAARAKQLRIERAYAAEPLLVAGIGGELNQVWTNLIDNAIDALPAGGRLTIRTRAEGDDALVEIEDDGPGIPADVRDRIWEPFFTTKDVGEGTGLGLDIVRRVVEERHRGQVSVESAPGRTVFRVRLPRRRPAVPPADAPAAGDDAGRR